MSAFTREEVAAKIGKRVRTMVDIAGVTSILVGTVIRADAVDDGDIVGVVWDPAERLFGDRFSKDDEERLTELTEPCGSLYAGPSTATGDAAWGRCTGVEGGAVMDDEHPVTDAEHITHTHELLTHAVRRAQDRPAYVAWALARVQVREGLSDEALAARLGIATVDLPRLALCLRPRPDHWAEDLAQIATRFGLAPEPLAAVLHTAEAPAARRHDPTG